MLTPEDIQKLKSASGNGGIPANQAMSDQQFSNWAKPTDPSIVDRAKSAVGNYFGRVAGDIGNTIKTEGDALNQKTPISAPKAVEKGLQVAGSAFGAAVSPITELFTPAVKWVMENNNPNDPAFKALKGLTSLAEKYPNASKDIASVANIAFAPSIMEGAQKTLESGVTMAKNAVTSPLSKEIANSTTGMQANYTETLPNVKFDGSQVLPKDLTDHVIGDIVGKLNMENSHVYNPELAKVVEGLKGQDFSSLKDIQTKVHEAITEGSNVVKPIVNAGEGAVSSTGENIMNRVARLTPNEADKFKAMTGMSHGEYLQRTGNFGTPEKIIENEAVKFTKSLQTVDKAMADLPGEYKPQPLTTALDELSGREGRVSSPGAPSPDLARVKFLQGKAKTSGLNMSEINEVKRIYEKNVKLDYLRQNLPEKVARANAIDSALRKWQFSQAEKLGLKNLPELNKQTQASKFIIDKLGKQLIGKTGNNMITLTDWIMLAGGEPTSVSAFLTKKLFSSKAVQARIAKMLSGEPDITQLEAVYGGKQGLPAKINGVDYSTTPQNPNKFNPIPLPEKNPNPLGNPAGKIFNQSKIDTTLKLIGRGENPIRLGAPKKK